MIYEEESFPTEVEAEVEGQRCSRMLYGYGYRYRVDYDKKNGVWVLSSSRYTSCD
jgi:hypothetical protein